MTWQVPERRLPIFCSSASMHEPGKPSMTRLSFCQNDVASSNRYSVRSDYYYFLFQFHLWLREMLCGVLREEV